MSKSKALIFFLLLMPCFAQVYQATVAAGGTGYTSAPTVTATGGSCTTEPTFTAAVSAGAVSSIAPTYLGAGCASAPTLAIGGPGTGATATAQLLPVTAAIQTAVPTSSCSGVIPTSAGACTAWFYACWLVVPAARVPFYGIKLFPMPGTSQTTSVPSGLPSPYSLPAGMQTDLANGTLTEYDAYTIVYNTVALATVEASVASLCANQQTAINAWNPWANFGTYYLNGTWTTLTVQ